MRRCVLAARRPPTSARAAHRCSRRPVRMTALAAARCRVIGPSSHMGGAPINATCARAIIINRIIRRFPRAPPPVPIAWCMEALRADAGPCGLRRRRAARDRTVTARTRDRPAWSARAERGARGTRYTVRRPAIRGNSAPRPARTLDASADRRSCSPNETPNCASGGEAKWRTRGRARIRGSWN